MININRINDRMSELKISKAQLIKSSGLTRVTIDKILSGGKINVDTLESLAKGLSVNVGYFFDEEVDKGELAIATGSAAASVHGISTTGFNQAEHDECIRLREEVKYLKELLADKDQRIIELKERIEELKSK